TRILLDGVNYSSWKSNIKWLNYTQECMLERNDWLERLYNYKLAWFYFSWQGMIDFNFLKTIKLKFIDYIIQEDDYFGIVLFSQLKHLYVFPNELYIYRIRPNSIMSYDSKITQKNISTFFQNNLKYFDNDPIRTKKYFHVSSSVKTYLELIKFLKLKRDSLLNKSLCKYLLPTYIKNAYEIIHFSIDPLNLLPNAKTIRKLMKKYNIKPYGIEFRFKNELPYRLGGAILQNCKSFKKIIKLPIRIYEIFNQNKREQKILQMRAMNNSYFELPKLQEYEDCYRLDSLKRHLSYKIGLSFLKHHKYGYFGGYFIFLFKIPVILLKIRKNKKEKEISNIYSEILNLKEHLHDIKTNINNLILQNKNFSFCNIYNNHLLSFFKNENLMEHFFHKSIAFIDLTDRYLENHKILSIFDNIYFYAFELDNFDFLLARKKNLKNIKIFNFILGIETSIKKKTYKLKSDIASQENSCFMQVKDIDWFLDNENFNGCELLILYLRLNSNTFGLLKHIILEKIYLKCFYIFCYIEDNFSHDVLYSEIKQEIKNHNINNIIIRINI
ncbi:hypothetical protein H2253_07100, partial [Campylobacter sp. RM9756]|nr:hypothetical protein [Campylobacter sp. RM9756]